MLQSLSSLPAAFRDHFAAGLGCAKHLIGRDQFHRLLSEGFPGARQLKSMLLLGDLCGHVASIMPAGGAEGGGAEGGEEPEAEPETPARRPVPVRLSFSRRGPQLHLSLSRSDGLPIAELREQAEVGHVATVEIDDTWSDWEANCSPLKRPRGDSQTPWSLAAPGRKCVRFTTGEATAAPAPAAAS